MGSERLFVQCWVLTKNWGSRFSSAGGSPDNISKSTCRSQEDGVSWETLLTSTLWLYCILSSCHYPVPWKVTHALQGQILSVYSVADVCVCGVPTTPKLKISDLGVTCPLRASGAMYAQVPTILSVIMVVEVPLGEALVNPKSEIFATRFSSNRIFALKKKTINQLICFIHMKL